MKSPGKVNLFASGKHTPESHSQEHTVRGLKLPQKAALAQAVRIQPMASAADVRRSLNLVERLRRDEVYISPVKHRSVVREVSKLRTEVLSEFVVGAGVDRTGQPHAHVRQDVHQELGRGAQSAGWRPSLAPCASLCWPSVFQWLHLSLLFDAFPPAACRTRRQ